MATEGHLGIESQGSLGVSFDQTVMDRDSVMTRKGAYVLGKIMGEIMHGELGADGHAYTPEDVSKLVPESAKRRLRRSFTRGVEDSFGEHREIA